MLCPETWRFTAPKSNYKEYKRNFLHEDSKKISPSVLFDFHYVHLVSIVLPNIEKLPHGLKELLSDDCDYYKVENISLAELINNEFIKKFIKSGELSVLSINTKLDTDNCVCITSQGVLVLHLDKVSYQELGLEGRVSHFANKKKNKYIVQINLKNLTTKLQIERIRKCFSERLNKFSLILSWHPPEDNICPSSIAKYLSNLGHDIFVCEQKFQTRNSKNVKVPVFAPKNADEEYGAELMEWLGMFSIEADLINGKYDNYINTYESPEEYVLCKNVMYLEWKGFYTPHQIQQLYEQLKKYVQGFSNSPWISLYVQGFSDAPVSWNLIENHFFTNSENAYGFFMKSDGKYLLCTQMCTNKRHK